MGEGAEAENRCLALHFCHSPWGFPSWLCFNCSPGTNKGLVWSARQLAENGQQWPGGGLEPRQNHILSGSGPQEGQTVCSCE